ncbi:hypothetical protein [Hoylesella loescheii]|jgi:hypothetical protein|uniref:hypothetical protein n=1 Tax=Hoylesella loescheii TaxID=840 RepID=UPI0028F12C69|nr:hypothetical protein [Hoylesella loescheii]
MKQLFILLLIWCYHATGLYAWKCLSLSDADAMSMNNRNINPETYTKKESYQYTRKGLQTNEKKISLDKYSNMAQIEWSIDAHKDTLNKKGIDKYQENDAKSYEIQLFNKKDYYGIKKTETGKYRLMDLAGQDVLKEEYDSIYFGLSFIIVERDNHIDVFTPQLNKLNIGKAKVVREIKESVVGCMEILNETGGCYYDVTGKKVKYPNMGCIEVCKTVVKWEHTIHKNKGKYRVQIYTDDPIGIEIKEHYWLSDLLPTDAVTFLDGDKSFWRSENSDSFGDIDVRPEWIRVGRNGKFGIVAYQYKQKKGVKPKVITERSYSRRSKMLVYPTLKITGKTILPINNDSIIMRSDGLIYFYKDKKVGLFPLNKVPVYDEITQDTESFYRIVKNGITGWLDIKTDKEYWK